MNGQRRHPNDMRDSEPGLPTQTDGRNSTLPLKLELRAILKQEKGLAESSGKRVTGLLEAALIDVVNANWRGREGSVGTSGMH
jgi:hypothetical protein